MCWAYKLTYFEIKIRTCTSRPLMFEPLRILLIAYQCSIPAGSDTGIPAEWIWNLRRSQLLSKHRFKYKCSTKVSPHKSESKTVLDFEFYIADSRFLQIRSVEPGFWIPIVTGIPDTLSCISDSKAQDFGSHKQKFPRLRNSWCENFK